MDAVLLAWLEADAAELRKQVERDRRAAERQRCAQQEFEALPELERRTLTAIAAARELHAAGGLDPEQAADTALGETLEGSPTLRIAYLQAGERAEVHAAELGYLLRDDRWRWSHGETYRLLSAQGWTLAEIMEAELARVVVLGFLRRGRSYAQNVAPGLVLENQRRH